MNGKWYSVDLIAAQIMEQFDAAQSSGSLTREDVERLLGGVKVHYLMANAVAANTTPSLHDGITRAIQQLVNQHRLLVEGFIPKSVGEAEPVVASPPAPPPPSSAPQVRSRVAAPSSLPVIGIAGSLETLRKHMFGRLVTQGEDYLYERRLVKKVDIERAQQGILHVLSDADKIWNFTTLKAHIAAQHWQDQSGNKMANPYQSSFDAAGIAIYRLVSQGICGAHEVPNGNSCRILLAFPDAERSLAAPDAAMGITKQQAFR